MKTAKAQYSEDKKAYDNRTPEQIDAANAAAAAAISVRTTLPLFNHFTHDTQLKKATTKPRASKAVATPASVTVQARPPPPAASPSTETSEDNSEEDEAPQVQQTADTESSDDEEEEEEEEAVPEPPPKKKRGGSAQPTTVKEKGKKSSKTR